MLFHGCLVELFAFFLQGMDAASSPALEFRLVHVTMGFFKSCFDKRIFHVCLRVACGRFGKYGGRHDPIKFERVAGTEHYKWATRHVRLT